MESELITLSEAAKLMGIGISTVYGYVYRGILPVAMRTPTGTMRVRRADVEVFGKTAVETGTRRKRAA
jgi:excisionase family DNA binding protein